jgi:hypothetical protein
LRIKKRVNVNVTFEQAANDEELSLLAVLVLSCINGLALCDVNVELETQQVLQLSSLGESFNRRASNVWRQMVFLIRATAVAMA